MKRFFVLALCFTVSVAQFSCGGSSGGDSNGSPEGSFDLTGTWTGTLSHVSVAGPCPLTPTQTGAVTIVQTGGTFTLHFGAGFTCSPAAACDFSGNLEGAHYTAGNAGTADSAGGTYATQLEFNAISANHAEGSGTSIYSHPAMECVWEISLILDR